jgi:hypothetical protein
MGVELASSRCSTRRTGLEGRVEIESESESEQANAEQRGGKLAPRKGKGEGFCTRVGSNELGYPSLFAAS